MSHFWKSVRWWQAVGGAAVFVMVLGATGTSVSAMSIELDVPERCVSASAGEAVYFEMSVKYPENDTRKDVRVEYFMKNPDGKDVAYLKVLKAVETQATFMDHMIVPPRAEPGVYRLVAKVGDYKGLAEEVGASFHVVRGAEDRVRFYFLILLSAIALVAALVSVELFILIRRRGR